MTLDATSLRYAIHDSAGVTIATASLSDTGTVRSENQDRCSVVATSDVVAIVLADGMGGGVGGGEAAEAAVRAVDERLAAADQLSAAVDAAILAVAAVRDAFGGGMVGTTLVAAVVAGTQITVANVGDSRAYICGADGGMRQITRDHSRAADLVASGALTEEEARHDGRRNMLTRAVTGKPVEVDTFELEWRRGDTLVLCSDGVWEPCAPDTLAMAWAGSDLGAGVLASCREALNAGSRDNVTVIAARLG